jgi:hypothetical protein
MQQLNGIYKRMGWENPFQSATSLIFDAEMKKEFVVNIFRLRMCRREYHSKLTINERFGNKYCLHLQCRSVCQSFLFVSYWFLDWHALICSNILENLWALHRSYPIFKHQVNKYVYWVQDISYLCWRRNQVRSGQVRVRVTLRLTVSQSVCLGV